MPWPICILEREAGLEREDSCSGKICYVEVEARGDEILN